MTAAILLQTLISLATLQLAFTNTPPVESSPPQIQEEVLSATSTASTPTPTAIPTHITYTTQTGDTIRKIAKEHYGSELYWAQIWNDNPELEDPAMIHPGLKLTIRTAKQTEVEELARALPTPTPTIAPTNEPTPTETLAKETTEIIHEQTGSPVGNFAQAYGDAGSKYGIPWQILSAIHQVETGRRDGPIGYEGGPQGPMQFMPGTWAVHGVDGNGDGTADINNAVDAIHSAANYLSKFPTIEQGLDAYGRIREDVMNIARSLGYNG